MPKRISQWGTEGKTCTKCRAYKMFADFSCHPGAVDGFQSHCKACVARTHREKKAGRPCQRCREPLPVNVRRWSKLCDTCRDLCVECGTRPRRPKRRRCEECHSEFQFGYHSKKAAVDPRAARLRRAMSTYGISRDFAEFLLSKGACEACFKVFSRLGELHIDHCHDTGVVRGVLCFNCNAALGHVRDSQERLQKLVLYLNKSQGKNESPVIIGRPGTGPP